MLEAAIDQVRGVLALLAAEGEMARDGARADGRRARGSLNTCAGNVLTVCVGGQLAQFDCASLGLPVAPPAPPPAPRQHRTHNPRFRVWSRRRTAPARRGTTCPRRTSGAGAATRERACPTNRSRLHGRNTLTDGGEHDHLSRFWDRAFRVVDRCARVGG
jgi:hypothetical protein